LLTRRVS